MGKSHDEFIEELKSKNPTVEVIGLYTKAHERIKVNVRNADMSGSQKRII